MRTINGKDDIGRATFDIYRAPSAFGYELRIGAYALQTFPNGDRGYGGRVTHLARPIEFGELPANRLASGCIGLNNEELQELMDALWSCGIRPSNGEGNVGQIGAMRQHLADMKEDKKFYQDMLRRAAHVAE